MTTDIVTVAAARTAVGKFGGALAKPPAQEQIGVVILSQVLTAGMGVALTVER